MKKKGLFILMASTIVGAVIAKNVSPFELQVSKPKVVLAKLEEQKKLLDIKSATTTGVTSIPVVEVVSNSYSGILNATYTATLEDGTVLGFAISSSTAYFCGAKTTVKAITVPETISYNGQVYAVNYIGRYVNSSYSLDFDGAISVESLILPSNTTYIYNSIPTTVSELHLLGTIPPNIYNESLNTGITVYVPTGAYATYQNYCTQSIN